MSTSNQLESARRSSGRSRQPLPQQSVKSSSPSRKLTKVQVEHSAAFGCPVERVAEALLGGVVVSRRLRSRRRPGTDPACRHIRLDRRVTKICLQWSSSHDQLLGRRDAEMMCLSPTLEPERARVHVVHVKERLVARHVQALPSSLRAIGWCLVV